VPRLGRFVRASVACAQLDIALLNLRDDIYHLIRSCQGPAYLYSFKAVLCFHSCLVSKKASGKGCANEDQHVKAV